MPERNQLEYESPANRQSRVIDVVRRVAVIAVLAFLGLFVGTWALLLWLNRDGNGPFYGLTIFVAGLLVALGISAAICFVACVAARRAGQ